MEQLLIVEDDRDLNHGLCKALKTEDRQIVSCADLHAAREQLALATPTLVLLDVNLPDGSGLDLLREIKAKTPRLPVILLTANDTDMDIVEGLEQGADDYITKPFSLSVLRARVSTQLRKAKTSEESRHYCAAPYDFDFVNMSFSAEGKAVELSKTEQKLLQLLVENAGATVPRAVLLDRIWTDGAEFVEENALSVTVKRLRDKLGARKNIQTIYGVGYSWVKENE